MKPLLTIIAVLTLAACNQPAKEITPEMRTRNLVVLTDLLVEDLAQRVRGTIDHTEKDYAQSIAIIQPSSIFNYEMCAIAGIGMVNGYSDIDLTGTWRRHRDGYNYMTAVMPKHDSMDREITIIVYYFHDHENMILELMFDE